MSSPSWDELRHQAAREAEEAARQARLRQDELLDELAAGRDERRREVEQTLDGMRSDCLAFFRKQEAAGRLMERDTGKTRGLILARAVCERYATVRVVYDHVGDYAPRGISLKVYADGRILVNSNHKSLEDCAKEWVEHAQPPHSRFSSWMHFAEELAKALQRRR